MRLYRTRAGAWAGTQAEAGKGFEQVEFPTDKPGLLAWLNANAAAPIATSLPIAPAFAPPPPAPRLSASTTLDRLVAFQELPDEMKLTALEEAIQSVDGFQLARLVSNVVSRLEELRREAKLAVRP